MASCAACLKENGAQEPLPLLWVEVVQGLQTPKIRGHRSSRRVQRPCPMHRSE